jgi:hypothetical protein
MKDHAVREETIVEPKPHLWLADTIAEPRERKQAILDGEAHDRGTIGMKREPIGKACELREMGNGSIPPGEKQLAAAIKRVREARAFRERSSQFRGSVKTISLRSVKTRSFGRHGASPGRSTATSLIAPCKVRR